MNLFTNVRDETGSGLSATLANWPPSVGDGGEVGLDSDVVMEDDNQYVSSTGVDDLNIQDVGLREDQVDDDFFLRQMNKNYSRTSWNRSRLYES